MVKRILLIMMAIVLAITAAIPVTAAAQQELTDVQTKPTDQSDASTENALTPIPIPELTETLKLMAQYNYITGSITGLSSTKVSKVELEKEVAKFGTLYGTGMSYWAYKKAMNYKWTDCTDYKNKPVKLSVDIIQTLDYDTYVDILKKLSRYDGVYLYKIGESQNGRALYSIEIDVESQKDKEVIMFTGQVHAREFAGGTYIVKMFVDLVQKAQTDKATMKYLKSFKYVAIPIINVDGREGLIYNAKAWTTKYGMWKAYVNGTDGNRNFPGVLWGEVSKGNSLKWSIRLKPGFDNYPGKTAGSCPETKAVMKFLYHYSVVEQALCLIDMHQQGHSIYAGKEWTTKEQETIADKLRTKVLNTLNKGNLNKYHVIDDKPDYGLDGTGSTITDYAISIASGAKFSPAFGFCVYTDDKDEYSLMELCDLDNAKFEVNAPNPTFSTLTVEIGDGTSYLGNSAYTRKLLAKEYTKYHYDTLMIELPNGL